MRGLSLLALPLFVVSPALAQETNSFRDWSVTCSPDAGCSAQVKGPSTQFALDRSEGAAGWYIRFDFSDPLPDPNRPLTLLIDGEKTVLQARSDWSFTGEAGRSFVRGNDSLRAALMGALQDGTQLIVEYIDVTGEPRRQLFSLSGLSASLLWAEEQMGIVGEERLASAPDQDAVDAQTATDIETLSIEASAIPAVVLERHQQSSACEALDSELMRDIPPLISRVSDTAIVYAIPCVVAAYNVTYRIYLRETGEIGGLQTLYFPQWSEAYGWSGTDLLFNVELKGDHLSATALGRGVGDCGTQADFTFLDYTFRLDRYAAEEECRGRLPADWPVIYEHGGEHGKQPQKSPT
ncbi:DUF1176 domain-containing protein [Afifella sp. JA880]|uniref:DUF1176 domain-containing protein n=1 Tax=Afifella sp. JA880 TaxID=2975280 RepID=UPI0021BB2C78|nr:DUF1176 domain-containing protein [Afifella sp. JA880]MCT8266178.1 DUF1176 domain-containing protein [Afifella sp. JA880]